MAGVAPGDRVDRPVAGVDPADSIVETVGDVDVPVRVDGHAVGLVELRRDGGPAVAPEGADRSAVGVRSPGAPGHGGDDPVDVDPSYAVVQRVGHEHVSGATEGHGPRVVELRVGGRATVAAEPALAVVPRHPGHGSDRARRVPGVGPGGEGSDTHPGGRQQHHEGRGQPPWPGGRVWCAHALIEHRPPPSRAAVLPVAEELAAPDGAPSVALNWANPGWASKLTLVKSPPT